MQELIVNCRKHTETIRKNQMELREVKNNVTEIKNAMSRLISRVDRKKDERYSKFEDISKEISQIEK